MSQILFILSKQFLLNVAYKCQLIVNLITVAVKLFKSVTVTQDANKVSNIKADIASKTFTTTKPPTSLSHVRTVRGSICYPTTLLTCNKVTDTGDEGYWRRRHRFPIQIH